MVYRNVKGAAGGVVWHFACPKIKKRCKELHLNGSTYVHTAAIERYYRSGHLEGITKNKYYELLMIKQKGDEAQKRINSKDLKLITPGNPLKGIWNT